LGLISAQWNVPFAGAVYFAVLAKGYACRCCPESDDEKVQTDEKRKQKKKQKKDPDSSAVRTISKISSIASLHCRCREEYIGINCGQNGNCIYQRNRVGLLS